MKNINQFSKNQYPITIPQFDKLIDDKSQSNKIIKAKCDILFVEGWCCGSREIPKKFLYKNINNLEKINDPKNQWRNFYNNKLKIEYKKLFKLFDELIFLKTSSFDNVYKWRLKQEKTNQSKNKKSKKMSPKEIKAFIQHYEKITKWMLKDLNKKAQVVIKFEKNHKISSINFN
jgi:Predicted kinase